MRKVTVSRMRERYAQTVFSFRITYVKRYDRGPNLLTLSLMAITYEPVEPRETCGVGVGHIHTYMVCLKCCLYLKTYERGNDVKFEIIYDKFEV